MRDGAAEQSALLILKRNSRIICSGAIEASLVEIAGPGGVGQGPGDPAWGLAAWWLGAFWLGACMLGLGAWGWDLGPEAPEGLKV